MGENKVESALQQYTINLTEKIKSDDWIKIIGRDDELNLLQQVLLRHDKPNAIIVGNDGIGKTKLVEGLAKIYAEKHPEYTFYQLDTVSLMSNILLKGELENRIKNIATVLKSKKSTVLFIDEMQTICGNSDFSSQGDIISFEDKDVVDWAIVKKDGKREGDYVRHFLQGPGVELLFG